MKTTLAALLLGLSSITAQAGAIGAFGGTMDTADFGSATLVGVKLEGTLIEPLAIELRGGYAFDFNDEGLRLEEFKMYDGEAGLLLRIPIGEYFSLHAGAGVGFYVMPEFDMTMPDGSIRSSDIGDAPGAYGLAGAEVGFQNIRLFAEAKYLFLRPETVKADFIDGLYEEIDIDLSGLAVVGGVVIRW